jgi:hypothetical protein
MKPKIDIHTPIDAGLKPSPPNSIEVDQTSGMSAVHAISMSESIP